MAILVANLAELEDLPGNLPVYVKFGGQMYRVEDMYPAFEQGAPTKLILEVD